MALSMQQVKSIQQDFMNDYFFKPPYNQYVNGVGISDLKTMQNIKKTTINLKPGESLDDLCLYVMLEKQLPSNLKLPSEYKGAKVISEVVGKAVIY